MGGPVKLIAVDGKPVVRAPSRLMKRLPVAVIAPGAHRFLVRLETEEGGGVPAETLLVSATVAPGKRYRFEESGRTLHLVEDRTVEWRGYVLHEVRSYVEMPPRLQTALGVDRPGVDGVADRDQRFNATDVIDGHLPMRRLLGAGHDGDTWLVALEHGGRAYRVEVFLFDARELTPTRKWVLFGRPRTLAEAIQEMPRYEAE